MLATTKLLLAATAITFRRIIHSKQVADEFKRGLVRYIAKPGACEGSYTRCCPLPFHDGSELRAARGADATAQPRLAQRSKAVWRASGDVEGLRAGSDSQPQPSF